MADTENGLRSLGIDRAERSQAEQSETERLRQQQALLKAEFYQRQGQEVPR